MPLFYRPTDCWTGDFIPFWWSGAYHLFYLRDNEWAVNEARGDRRVSWWHVSTRDFVAFTDHGEAVPGGGEDAQDREVITGSVIERAGTFHCFYTGQNTSFAERGDPPQVGMHATSRDLLTWTKDARARPLPPDLRRYERDDWRDPFVFWNEEASEYWMLLAARTRQGPMNRRGCVALATSRDLEEWTVLDPFWAPSLYYTHECPDIFRIGDWWYLVYSTFSERMVTHYRMSRRLDGPWTAPANDTFDGRGYYAAKTASDGQRRFAFGWVPTRAEQRDSGRWQWGGHLVVHEIVQEDDGALVVRPPDEVIHHFGRRVVPTPAPRLGQWDTSGALSTDATDHFAWCALGPLPGTCRLAATITFAPQTRACGIVLRADPSLDHYYQIRLEPGRNRVVFDRWPRPGDEPFVIERPVPLTPGQPTHLRILVDGSLIVAYVDDRVGLSARGYDQLSGGWGAFVSEGRATFEHVGLTQA